jgi:hypothetical protein
MIYRIKVITENIDEVIEQLNDLKNDPEFHNLKDGESFLYKDLWVDCDEV